eukprot:1307691-Amphidinium_carterae.1
MNVPEVKTDLYSTLGGKDRTLAKSEDSSRGARGDAASGFLRSPLARIQATDRRPSSLRARRGSAKKTHIAPANTQGPDSSSDSHEPNRSSPPILSS